MYRMVTTLFRDIGNSHSMGLSYSTCIQRHTKPLLIYAYTFLYTINLPFKLHVISLLKKKKDNETQPLRTWLRGVRLGTESHAYVNNPVGNSFPHQPFSFSLPTLSTLEIRGEREGRLSACGYCKRMLETVDYKEIRFWGAHSLAASAHGRLAPSLQTYRKTVSTSW